MDSSIFQSIIEAAQDIWAALSISIAWFFQSAWPFIWEWVIIGIIYKAIVAHYASKWLIKWSKKKLVKSKSQVALWFHYRDRAMKRGHDEHPQLCADGLCGEVNVSE